MTGDDQVAGAVEAAIDAVQRDDGPAMITALVELGRFDQIAVLEELFDAVQLAARQMPEAAVPTTVFMPDPSRSTELLRAVTAADEGALLRLADRDPAALVTALIGLAAALRMVPDDR